MFRLEYGWLQSLVKVAVWKVVHIFKLMWWSSAFGSFLLVTFWVIPLVHSSHQLHCFKQSMATTPLCHSILCFLSPLEVYTKLPQCSCSKVCRQFVPGEPQPMHALLPAELWFSVFSSHSWLIVCYLLHQQGKGHAFTAEEKNRGWVGLYIHLLFHSCCCLGEEKGMSGRQTGDKGS